MELFCPSLTPVGGRRAQWPQPGFNRYIAEANPRATYCDSIGEGRCIARVLCAWTFMCTYIKNSDREQRQIKIHAYMLVRYTQTTTNEKGKCRCAHIHRHQTNLQIHIRLYIHIHMHTYMHTSSVTRRYIHVFFLSWRKHSLYNMNTDIYENKRQHFRTL